ncbi:polygalacturonase [Iris pallida]|uniref:Polygalacturonase n=1 Tax=Iris pallida TaxID=29817 RepID=A0AAX6GHL8_IRIPA|nr:polygalacturonase [Iris pallida]
MAALVVSIRVSAPMGCGGGCVEMGRDLAEGQKDERVVMVMVIFGRLWLVAVVGFGRGQVGDIGLTGEGRKGSRRDIIVDLGFACVGGVSDTRKMHV